MARLIRIVARWLEEEEMTGSCGWGRGRGRGRVKAEDECLADSLSWSEIAPGGTTDPNPVPKGMASLVPLSSAVGDLYLAPEEDATTANGDSAGHQVSRERDLSIVVELERCPTLIVFSLLAFAINCTCPPSDSVY